jgi:hypothetical protein
MSDERKILYGLLWGLDFSKILNDAAASTVSGLIVAAVLAVLKRVASSSRRDKTARPGVAPSDVPVTIRPEQADSEVREVVTEEPRTSRFAY